MNDRVMIGKLNKIRKRKSIKVLMGLGFITTVAMILMEVHNFIISPIEVGAQANYTEDLQPTVMEEEDISMNTNQLIVIDPGHGGQDEGCSWAGVDEKDINLDIAVRLEKILINHGLEVVMTRSDDTWLLPEERVEIANHLNAKLFISIHQNAHEDIKISGIETLYSDADPLKDNKIFAQVLQTNIAKQNTDSDRGIALREDLIVLTQTTMTACLVETGFLSNPEERKNLTDENQRQIIAENLALGIYEYLNKNTITPEQPPEKIMQLTFDDGPRESTTPLILDILKEHNIKATFFLIGSNVEKYPELAKRIVDEGHAIGVHCYSHEYNEIYASVDSFIGDFERASNAIELATGIRPKLFRFPGGSINAYNKNTYADIINEMTKRGYIYYDWNASLEDTMGNVTKEDLLQSAVDTAAGRKRLVLLAHDTKVHTVEVLEDLLKAFSEYYFDIIEEEDLPIQF